MKHSKNDDGSLTLTFDEGEQFELQVRNPDGSWLDTYFEDGQLWDQHNEHPKYQDPDFDPDLPFVVVVDE